MDAYITKIQVEGGFLDGLDLDLQNGLNAIIGARGTGKSTLVELIRFALGVTAHSSDSSMRALSHARTVLQDGQVTITLNNGYEDYIFSRMANDEAPDISKGLMISPMIFSQTEVENIGLLSSGRLKLIDGFVNEKTDSFREEEFCIAQIRSLTTELWQLTNQVSDINERLLQLPTINKQLDELLPKEVAIALVSEEAKDKTSKLEQLTKEYSHTSKITEYLEEFIHRNHIWLDELKADLQDSKEEVLWLDDYDILGNIKVRRQKVIESIQRNIEQLQEIINDTVILNNEHLKKKQMLSNESQKLRLDVEKMQEGAGEVIRTGQRLRTEKAQLESLSDTLEARKSKITVLIKKRDNLLDTLEHLRAKRSQNRIEFADKLNKLLAPKIKIEVEEAGQLDEYVSVLIEAMKGTGIKYNELAPLIASSIPPRELLHIVENNLIDEMTALVSMSRERAFRLIHALKDSDLADIATVLLEDEIKFKLLDGGDFKDFSELSTGQRCTVILPIILEHRDTILVIDQPEDHIDNAFIADTLITAILRRARTSQLIVTTHNANIPVLGDAAQVVHLNSDGKRGFVEAEGPLDNINVVNAISDVMEGGKEAFSRRAIFYQKANDD